MTFPDERAALAALANNTATPVDLREIVVSYPQLWPVVAAYPGTDDPMLGWLRDRHDPLVDAALAKRVGAAAAPATAAVTPSAPSRPTGQPPAQAAGQSPAPASDSEATVVRPADPGPEPTVVLPVAGSAQPPAGGPQPVGPHPAGPAQPPRGPVQPQGPGQPPHGPVQPDPVADTVVYPIAPSGQPGSPLPPTPVPVAPGGTPPSRGSGLKIAAIVAAVVVLLGGGVWILMASGLIPGMSSALPGPPEVSLGPTSQAPTPIEPPSPQQSEPQQSETPVIVPTTEPPQNPGVVCWNRDQVDQLTDCPVPQNKDQAWEYLRHVFPSSNNHGTCEQADSTGKSDYKGMTVMWNCELGNALLRYRFWDDPSDAERHYGRKFKTGTKTYELLVDGQPANGWVKVLTKRDKSTKRYILTMWLPDLRLSLSAEGDTTDDMWEAFGLVRLNPDPGYPAGTVPTGLPVTVR